MVDPTRVYKKTDLEMVCLLVYLRVRFLCGLSLKLHFQSLGFGVFYRQIYTIHHGVIGVFFYLYNVLCYIYKDAEYNEVVGYDCQDIPIVLMYTVCFF